MSENDKNQDELRRLRRENESLNEQLKLQVKTEQRLYRLRSRLDRQLSRIRDLGDFALDSARLEDAGDILDRALLLLLDNFDLDHAAAVRADRGTGRLQIISWPGERREDIVNDPAGDLLQWVESMPRTRILTPTELGADRLQCLLNVMMPASEICCAENPLGLCMPLRSADESVSGFVLACRINNDSGADSKEAITEAQIPFLQLLANHVERALQNAGLTGELRERSRQLADANRQLTASLENLGSTQQQLLQAKKMEAVGRLAGGIAHDFNNLLTVILGHAQLLNDRQPALSRDHQDVAQIIEAANHATEIVGQLLAFSRKQKSSPEILDINELTRTMTRMLGRLIGEHIALSLRTDPDLPRIRADRAHVEQIVMNLVVNARDAMPRGGTLSIDTRRARPSDLVELSDGPQADTLIALSVSDTGHGMDDATRSQIFEPFFTTKAGGRGSGMGLATVYGLVRQNDGQIVVASEVGSGTCFTVLFPLVTESASYEPLATAPAAETAEATILLAEDDPGIRRLLCEVLRAEGFEVLEAADGKDALEAARSHGSHIDLLVCDVVMPRVGGVNVFRDLRLERPDLPVLFISGYTFDSLKGGELAGEPYMQKPFMPADLVERVRQLLRRRRMRVVKLPEQGN